MTYRDFYDLSCYTNKIWRGKFTEREIACMAYDWLTEFEESKVLQKPTVTISHLLTSLLEDGLTQSHQWYKDIYEAIYG